MKWNCWVLPAKENVNVKRAATKMERILFFYDPHFRSAVLLFARIGIVGGDGLGLPVTLRLHMIGFHAFFDEVVSNDIGTLLRKFQVGLGFTHIVRMSSDLHDHIFLLQ